VEIKFEKNRKLWILGFRKAKDDEEEKEMKRERKLIMDGEERVSCLSRHS
tara:strand:+ start:426 stop:575 length:150 start_codon:yes stop_codon:yes gene_type:complete